MTKKNTTPEYMTREILKEEVLASEKRLTAKIGGEISGVEKRLTAKIGEEIGGVEERLGAKITGLNAKVGNIEKRLDAKIETTARSLKEYFDVRFTRLDAKIDSIERTLIEQGKRMDVYFQRIVKLVEGVTGKVSIADDRLIDHEVRITALERKGPQPGRI